MIEQENWLDNAARSWVDSLALEDFAAARERLADRVVETPVWHWRSRSVAEVLDSGCDRETEIWLKLELFQHTGTFKIRGALLNMLALEDLRQGVTAVSAGNHAVAVAYAAKTLGTTAKVVMPESANPARVERCRQLGAEVCLAADVHQAFVRVAEIEALEGRSLIHPFEGSNTILGTGTLGWEIAQQVVSPDWLVVPVGGGGLIAGVAAAVKLKYPECRVVGVEPTGADTMTRSLRAGRPQQIDRVDTIADSLAAPHTAPISFAVCRRFVDEVVLIEDLEMRRAMLLMFEEAKLAVEPAGAAAVAAIVGPLRSAVQGSRVVALVCGSNIDAESYSAHLAAARENSG